MKHEFMILDEKKYLLKIHKIKLTIAFGDGVVIDNLIESLDFSVNIASRATPEF